MVAFAFADLASWEEVSIEVIARQGGADGPVMCRGSLPDFVRTLAEVLKAGGARLHDGKPVESIEDAVEWIAQRSK